MWFEDAADDAGSFEAWKESLFREGGEPAPTEEGPYEPLLEKLVSLSELMERIETVGPDESARARDDGVSSWEREVRYEDLDALIAAEESRRS